MEPRTTMPSITEFSTMCKNQVEEFSRQSVLVNSIRPRRELAKWEPPPFMSFKVNVDAATHQDGNGGISCIIRDYRGRVLASAVKIIHSVVSIDLLEAQAAIFGATMAKDLWCNKVIIEGDSSKVFTYSLANGRDLSAFGTLMSNLWHLCSAFSDVSLSWNFREANKPAHILVKFSSSFEDFHVWLDNLLDCIVEALFFIPLSKYFHLFH